MMFAGRARWMLAVDVVVSCGLASMHKCVCVYGARECACVLCWGEIAEMCGFIDNKPPERGAIMHEMCLCACEM